MSSTSAPRESNTHGPFAGAWVFLGGALGSLLRAVLLFNETMLLSSLITLIAINLLGSFLLGLITGWLSSRPKNVKTQRIQLLVGTGALGGFTSYSALTLVTSQLLSLSLPLAAAFALGSVVFGCAAAWLGLTLGRRSASTQ